MISALLIDLDGTVYSQGQGYPGASFAIDFLRRRKIPFRFITNTTGMSRGRLVKRLAGMGIESTPADIFIAPQAAALYCRKQGYRRVWLATRDEAVFEEFDGLELTQENPQAVVLADFRDDFSYARMNALFGAVLAGAELVAMQKGRYWLTEEYGPTLDLGPYVAALEYATAKQAIVVGKPARLFFDLALEGWSLPRAQIAVVGDSVENDLRWAEAAGLQSIMVRTGIYDAEAAGISADWTIDSLADMPALLDRLQPS